MIRRTLLAGRAYAAVDIDSPDLPMVAVAWQADDGWGVATADGETVAAQLTKRSALILMRKTAAQLLDRAATRALLSGSTR